MLPLADFVFPHPTLADTCCPALVTNGPPTKTVRPLRFTRSGSSAAADCGNRLGTPGWVVNVPSKNHPMPRLRSRVSAARAHNAPLVDGGEEVPATANAPLAESRFLPVPPPLTSVLDDDSAAEPFTVQLSPKAEIVALYGTVIVTLPSAATLPETSVLAILTVTLPPGTETPGHVCLAPGKMKVPDFMVPFMVIAPDEVRWAKNAPPPVLGMAM